MITAHEDREKALRAGLEALSEDVPMTLEQLRSAAEGWDLISLEEDGEAAGVVMVRENRVHVAIREKFRGRWYSRRLHREVLGSLLDKYGVLQTCVRKSKERNQRFVEALGFRKTGETPWLYLYALEA